MGRGTSRAAPGGDVTRRAVLQGASVVIAASLADPVLSAWGDTQAAARGEGSSAPVLKPADMPKAWSVAEINRRWQITREWMKKAQLDCLVVPQHRPGGMVNERMDGDMDVEWLTGNSLPFMFVILPLDGTVTAISDGKIRNTPEEKLTAERKIEVRFPQGGKWSAAIADCLREKGMARARIGVGNLVDAARQPEGEISYTTYDRVLKALPQATFVPAGELLTRVKLVKSPEEIAVLEKSVAVGEIALQAMMNTARPGVAQRVVWLAMYNAMVNASGERPFRLSIAAGAPSNSTVNRPVEDLMKAGQILSQECTGTVLGIGTQVNHSVLVGPPAPPDWATVGQYSLDTLQAVIAAIAPGKTIKEACLVNDKWKEAVGQKGGGVLFHSAETRTGSDGEGADIVLAPGMVFNIKPTVVMKDGQPAQFGESIVVTDKSARRLGTRALTLITVGA